MEAEFLREYGNLLKALTRPEKRDINVLSMLAEDNKQFAGGIVATIANHILMCPAPSKLPALYVVDSIVKNVREPYTSLFAQRLPEVFGAVWSSAMADRRASLTRLYNTWTGIFTPTVLELVQARMTSAQPAVAQQLGQPAFMQLGQQVLHAQMYNAPAVLVAAQQPMQQQQQQPVYVATTDLRGLAGQVQQLQGPIQYVQQQPQFFEAPMQQPVVYSTADGMPQQQLFQPGPVQQVVPFEQLQPQFNDQFNQPLLQQQQFQQQAQQQLLGNGFPLPPASPADAAWQQPPPPQRLPVPQDPRRALRSPSPLTHAVPPTPPMAPQPASPPMPLPIGMPNPTGIGAPAAAPPPSLTSQQLSSLLSSLAKTGVLGGAGAVARAPLPEGDPAIRTLDFTPSFLKTFHKGVVAELQRGSNRTRKDILDAAFTRKQRQRTAAAASRQWFVGVDAWIAGTLAVSEAAPAFFEEQAKAEAVEEAPVHNEPEDPSQPECAISGEPFDKFYAAASADGSVDEGWYYRDAVRLHGEEAARYGVPDGAIVKAKCLAEAPGHVDASAAGDAPGLAADMAAAAAGADAAAHAAGHGAAAGGAEGGGGMPEEGADVAVGAEAEGGGMTEVKSEEGDVKEALKLEAMEGEEAAANAVGGVKRGPEQELQEAGDAKRARQGDQAS